jgi:hypothetical protein
MGSNDKEFKKNEKLLPLGYSFALYRSSLAKKGAPWLPRRRQKSQKN